MANSKEKIAEFVRNNEFYYPYPDAIPRMHRMLKIDRSITNINIKDSTWADYTALHSQSWYGTTGSVAWLLWQDPPPDIEVQLLDQRTPLFDAAVSQVDSEGKVRHLLDHGANRDARNMRGLTALDYARLWNKNPAALAAVADMLENYRPDVSR